MGNVPAVKYMKTLERDWSPTLGRRAVIDLLTRTANVPVDEPDEDADEDRQLSTPKEPEAVGSEPGGGGKITVDLYRFYVDRKTRRKSMQYFKSPEEMEQLVSGVN